MVQEYLINVLNVFAALPSILSPSLFPATYPSTLCVLVLHFSLFDKEMLNLASKADL